MVFQRLVTLKEQANLTNADIARKSGIPESTVARILSGNTDNPSFSAIRDIAIALGASLDDIAGMSNHMENHDSNVEKAYSQMIAHMEESIRTKDRWIRYLFIFSVSVVSIVIIALVLDILNVRAGWIQIVR